MQQWHVRPSTRQQCFCRNPHISKVFGSWKPVALAHKQIRIVTIVKFFIDWTSNLVELDRAMAKVPVIDLSPFLRAQEKAPRLWWDKQNLSTWSWRSLNSLQSLLLASETTQTLYTLFHSKLFLFQIESGHIQHLSFSTHLSGVQSPPYEGQMWQSATYLRTVGCIWGGEVASAAWCWFGQDKVTATLMEGKRRTRVADLISPKNWKLWLLPGLQLYAKVGTSRFAPFRIQYYEH